MVAGSGDGGMEGNRSERRSQERKVFGGVDRDGIISRDKNIWNRGYKRGRGRSVRIRYITKFE